MPEGDTLHRAARDLAALVGDVVSARAEHPRGRVTGVAAAVDGRRLTGVEARGKHLLLRFEGGVVLRSHLGMTGSWRVLPPAADVPGSPWLVLRGRRGQAVLRGGARLDLSTRDVDRLGPDILADPLDRSGILANLRSAGPGRAIGELLLDQRLVAGIGNVWRCEALWHARLSPWARIEDVGGADLERTLHHASALMRESVAGRRPPFAVYRRAGRPCPRCGDVVRSRPQGEQARTAYWCPGCQAAGARS